MSRVVVVGALPESLLNFRGELLKGLAAGGHQVTAMAAAADAALVERLSSIGVAFRPFPVQRNGLNPCADLRTFRALRSAFSELQPDVVLCYTVKPVVWGGLALRGLPGARFYALVTGLGFAFHGSGVARRLLARLVVSLYRAALTRASAVVFQNPDNRDEFVARGIVGHDRCALVNGSGVDLDHFGCHPLDGGDPVFLSIGRLLGEKGFREYAHAAALVRERYPDARFLLLGPPDPSPDGIPLEEVRRWESEAGVQYLGSADDVRPYLKKCHVYVLPSYHEGMPRTVLEAMAMGRPILTTDVPGCRETVVKGENGHLVPLKDAEALAGQMTWFIENRDRWQSMGDRSRELARERFDVHSVNRELVRVFGLGEES